MQPLSVSPSSRWQAYFRDNEVLLQIDKDVRRLCPDMCFFQRPTEHPCTRIAANPRVQGLRERVQRSMLRAANVTRSRQGITNVSATASLPPSLQHRMCTVSHGFVLKGLWSGSAAFIVFALL